MKNAATPGEEAGLLLGPRQLGMDAGTDPAKEGSSPLSPPGTPIHQLTHLTGVQLFRPCSCPIFPTPKTDVGGCTLTDWPP